MNKKVLRKAWCYVVLCCVIEIIWVFGLKVSSTLWHWFLTVFFIFTGFYCLNKACETLPNGTVYAIFAASGTVGVALLDIFIFDAPFDFVKAFFISLVVIGIVILKLSDNKN